MSIKNYLTDSELEHNIKTAHNVAQIKRWQVIFLRRTQPQLDVTQVAKMCGVAYATVTQWVWMYNKFGLQKYILQGRGGRRNALMSLPQEAKLLSALKGKAHRGKIITAHKVREQAKKILQRDIPKDYAYDLLHRHKWRKIAPRAFHPKRDIQVEETFKKTSPPCWLPPKRNSG